jgi:phenylalanyl-tRNA synthetase beta chain
MKLPAEWLKEYCDINITNEQIVTQLTMAGIECELLNEPDEVIDISLTPNRADCFSVLGVSRELAALNNMNFKSDQNTQTTIDHNDEIEIKIESPKDCPVLMVRIINDIDINATTPAVITKRLNSSGIQSVNIIVDITNYVMLETGQPLHAYDLRAIDSELIVRRGHNKENITLLDGSIKTVDQNFLLISDVAKALGIAGIMGGENSGIQTDTKNIVLESAYFNNETIMGKPRILNLHTESGLRFERGVDPSIQNHAIERASKLINEYSGGKNGPITNSTSISETPKRLPILLRKKRIHQILGITIPNNRIKEILTKLNMKIKEQDYGYSGWMVTPPLFRFDINQECDLIEELARLNGYDNIDEQNEHGEIKLNKTSVRSIKINHINNLMSGLGYSEVINYSFISPSMSMIQGENINTIDITNPLSIDMSIMRASLLPGLLNNLLHNLKRQHRAIKLFESGKVFKNLNTPNRETEMLAGIGYGLRMDEQWITKLETINFYDIKGDLEQLFSSLRINTIIQYDKSTHPMLCPGRTAEIILDGKTIGYIGELNPELSMDLELSEQPILFEMDKEVLKLPKKIIHDDQTYFPSSRRDISIIISEEQAISEIIKVINTLNIKELKNIIVFDVYKGENIETGRISIALGLIFQNKSRTLTDDEIDSNMSEITKRILSTFNIKLRKK